MIIDRHEEIFAGFLNREYDYKLTNVELMFEIKILRTCVDREDYIRVKRNGATLALNRAKRHGIYDLYQNALNHTMAEVEMEEAWELFQ
jgi:hypothetical protein